MNDITVLKNFRTQTPFLNSPSSNWCRCMFLDETICGSNPAVVEVLVSLLNIGTTFAILQISVNISVLKERVSDIKFTLVFFNSLVYLF